MFQVYFTNFQMTKHFSDCKEAIEHAKGSGFECIVTCPNGGWVGMYRMGKCIK